MKIPVHMAFLLDNVREIAKGKLENDEALTSAFHEMFFPGSLTAKKVVSGLDKIYDPRSSGKFEKHCDVLLVTSLELLAQELCTNPGDDLFLSLFESIYRSDNLFELSFVWLSESKSLGKCLGCVILDHDVTARLDTYELSFSGEMRLDKLQRLAAVLYNEESITRRNAIISKANYALAFEFARMIENSDRGLKVIKQAERNPSARVEFDRSRSDRILTEMNQAIKDLANGR